MSLWKYKMDEKWKKKITGENYLWDFVQIMSLWKNKMDEKWKN